MTENRKYRKIARALIKRYQPVAASREFKQKLLNEFTARADALAANAVAVNSQKIAVVVHVDSEVLNGFIAVPREMRLSDYLNTSVQFIKLTEVSLSHADGTSESVPEIHVNKEAVRMLRTVESDAARTPIAQTADISRRLVKKIPVQAMMLMADYKISGSLYCRDISGIDRLLEQKHVFLPCTGVTIRELHGDKEWQTGFAAVNRKQVNSLQTVSRN